jgi:hypothetical protein
MYLSMILGVLATWDIRSNKCVLKMSFTRIFSSLATERASFSTLLFILLL